MPCGHLPSNGCSSSERHISAVLRFTRNTKTSSGITQPFPGNKSIVSTTEFYRTQASARANDRAGAKMMMCMYASRLHIAIEIVCTHRFVSFEHTCMHTSNCFFQANDTPANNSTSEPQGANSEMINALRVSIRIGAS